MMKKWMKKRRPIGAELLDASVFVSSCSDVEVHSILCDYVYTELLLLTV